MSDAPTSTILDKEYWLQRAKETRAEGARMTNSESRQYFLMMAETYERIAGHSKRRAKIEKTPDQGQSKSGA